MCVHMCVHVCLCVCVCNLVYTWYHMHILFLQSLPKKLKVHDSFQVMHAFSHAWKQYPVLFDEAVRNAKFKENFHGAGAYIRQCYEELATKLHTTPDDVRK